MFLGNKLRIFIKRLHLAFDAFIGKTFFRQNSLGGLSNTSHEPILLNNFSKFSYSQKHHFSILKILPQHLNQTPATCDLKVYQDSLVYSFILDNLQKGARLLEIGGGESRIIAKLKHDYEIWNLDKLEGSGFGPINLMRTKGFHLVKDYIGSFTKELPDHQFDLVYSISTIEHISKKPNIVESSIQDIQRLIKPGGFSLHCVDALLYDDHYFVHPFVDRVHELGLVSRKRTSFNEIIKDDDLWVLSPYAFYTRWFHLVRKPLQIFGHPFSINVLWQQ